MSANPGALPGWFPRRTDEEAQPDPAKPAEDSPDPAANAAHSTTGGGKDDQTPVVVWEAANRLEAEIVAGRLHSENIPTIIRGEALGTIYGLTTGSLAAATVLVPAMLAEKAIQLLASDVEWDEVEQTDDSGDDSGDFDPDMNADHQPNG